MRILTSLLTLAAIGAPVLRADVTLRYKNDSKSAMPIPQVAVALPTSPVTYLRGTKGYMDAGNISVFMDFEKQEVTMVNAAAKQSSTVPMRDYASSITGAIPAIPEAARKMMDSLKVDVASKATGRTDTVAGVQVEETEITVNSTMDIPGLQSGGQPLSRMVMQVWHAKKEEAFRVPALRELMNYTLYSEYFMGSNGAVQKMLAASPGAGKAMGPLLAELQKNQMVALRTHISIYMPMMAMMQRAAGSTAGAAPDPNAPVVEMTSEATELSNTPVADAAFQIPEGLSPVSMADLFKSSMPAVTMPAVTPAKQ